MSDGRLPVRRRWVRWVVGSAVTLVVLSLGWVAIRGLGAVNDLQEIADGAGDLKAAIIDGDMETAESVAGSLARHAASAHALTSDPIWAAYGVLPWIGPNFRAVGEVAAIADDISENALSPVLAAANEVDLADLGFVNGAVDLAPFEKIEKPLAGASATLSDADRRAHRIDADATLEPLAEAIGTLRDSVTQANTVVGALHGASVLLPSMLGADGPRDYVVAMQNNAEVRSTGGIIGSLALMHAEGGKITLVQQASTLDFPKLDTPLPVSEPIASLFEDRPGRYLQNITNIPDFTESAPLIAQRWQDRFGGTVDGVLAVDAVVARHLVKATGPLTFGGFTVDSDNIVSFLLSDIYATFPDPEQQDIVFGQAASALFGAAFSGAEPRSLISALAMSADEDRVRIWSAHPDEQAVLAASTLGGALPHDADDGTTAVGVLMNDTTGGKMDYYTRASIVNSIGTCDGKPTTQVQVTWTNTAPADAATSLPFYVTAGGHYGVPAGSVRTLIAVYGPEGSAPTHVDRDGAEEGVQSTVLSSRPVVQHTVLLAPGESTTITIEFQGAASGAANTTVHHTPLVEAPTIDTREMRCAS